MRFVKRRYEANTLHIQIHQQPIVPLLQPIEVLPFVEGRFYLVVKAVKRGDDGLYVVLIDLEGDVYAVPQHKKHTFVANALACLAFSLHIYDM